jgi:hypothetical protein
VLLAWLDSTFTTRTVPPTAIASPTTTAMINRTTALLFLTGLLVRAALGMPYGTVKVTVADRPVCCLKLTGTTVAW